MKCNEDCFNCPYDDCIKSDSTLTDKYKRELELKNRRNRKNATLRIMAELQETLYCYKYKDDPYCQNIKAGLSCAIQIMGNGLKRIESEGK